VVSISGNLSFTENSQFCQNHSQFYWKCHFHWTWKYRNIDISTLFRLKSHLLKTNCWLLSTCNIRLSNKSTKIIGRPAVAAKCRWRHVAIGLHQLENQNTPAGSIIAPHRTVQWFEPWNNIYFFIFLSYILISIYLNSDDIFEDKKIIFPIKWGKLVHGEVWEFFCKTWFLPFYVLFWPFFSPQRRIFGQFW
jgi:hypothetical protein